MDQYCLEFVLGHASYSVNGNPKLLVHSYTFGGMFSKISQYSIFIFVVACVAKQVKYQYCTEWSPYLACQNTFINSMRGQYYNEGMFIQ